MIFVEEPVTWKQIAVPPSIVRECAEFTHQDPDSKDDLSRLILLDCYWHKMGYYGNVDSYYSVFHSLSMPNTVFPNVNCPVPYTILSNFNGFEVNP